MESLFDPRMAQDTAEGGRHDHSHVGAQRNLHRCIHRHAQAFEKIEHGGHHQETSTHTKHAVDKADTYAGLPAAR
jgi:hypothetical protein